MNALHIELLQEQLPHVGFDHLQEQGADLVDVASVGIALGHFLARIGQVEAADFVEAQPHLFASGADIFVHIGVHHFGDLRLHLWPTQPLVERRAARDITVLLHTSASFSGSVLARNRESRTRNSTV